MIVAPARVTGRGNRIRLTGCSGRYFVSLFLTFQRSPRSAPEAGSPILSPCRSAIVNDPFCEISYSEKVRIFSSDYLKCCIYISNRHTPDHVFTKKLYSKLISTSQVLEDFLDFHGAKNSEDWYLYRELCATVGT
jgi:hypothetical protein